MQVSVGAAKRLTLDTEGFYLFRTQNYNIHNPLVKFSVLKIDKMTVSVETLSGDVECDEDIYHAVTDTNKVKRERPISYDVRSLIERSPLFGCQSGSLVMKDLFPCLRVFWRCGVFRWFGINFVLFNRFVAHIQILLFQC